MSENKFGLVFTADAVVIKAETPQEETKEQK